MDARPPQMQRRPFILPLSRLKGATPTRAAICLRLSAPNSGRSASIVTDKTGPAPGTLWIILSFPRHSGRSLMARRISLSISLRRFSIHWMCTWMSLRTRLEGVGLRRFFSAVSISTNADVASAMLPAHGSRDLLPAEPQAALSGRIWQAHAHLWSPSSPARPMPWQNLEPAEG